MSEPDFNELLLNLDKRDMAGYTRNFVDDLRSSMSIEVGIEEDNDWSGVLCLSLIHI